MYIEKACDFADLHLLAKVESNDLRFDLKGYFFHARPADSDITPLGAVAGRRSLLPRPLKSTLGHADRMRYLGRECIAYPWCARSFADEAAHLGLRRRFGWGK